MKSTRFLQCLVPLILAMIPMNACSAWNQIDSSDQERSLFLQLNNLQKKIDELEHQIRWLQKQEDDCKHDLQRIRRDLDQLC
jgi:hypothetical protein